MPVQEKLGQGREFIRPFAERGQGRADHVRTEKEILAKRTGLHRLPEIFVYSGNDSNIDRHPACAADSMEFSVLEHTQ